MTVRIERRKHKGWTKCYRLSNALVDLVLTADVGPRIIRFGFVGDNNEFCEFEEMLGKRGGNEWRIYGGHRLWHAPEAEPRTYAPDNSPVKVERHDRFLRCIQSTELTTGIQKEIDVRLSPNKAQVEVTHRLRNTNAWAVELAPWALSTMAPGGTAIIPLPPRGSHPENLPPVNTFTLWAYTDMTDPRWTWGFKNILLRQDSRAKLPQKIGVMVPDGWTAYTRNEHLFVKQFRFDATARYADFGSNVEVFTNNRMLELETLGPLVHLQPWMTVEYVERWSLFRGVPMPMNDADVDRHVRPKIRPR
ncbi:MAG TPA: hypothetical protein VLZ12_02520 [Verrucomicrobiae bacterium]|nr:hypothetical protein [Verrucomicrobiae bacterium]